ncbi:MAG: hypothetical protein ACREIT_09045, partial [Tepidisphaeraceae bacterium]
VQNYLTARMRQFDIGEDGLDRRQFVEQLIGPAYQQGLARLLIRNDFSVRLYGRGWGGVEEFAPHAAGEVRSRAGLLSALRTCGALVHCWPHAHAHPIDACGRPVVRRTGKRRQTFLAHAHAALRGTPDSTPVVTVPPLTGVLVRALLAATA